MKRQLAALLLTIFALSLTACGETAAESETRTVYAMDTVMNLTVYGENAAAALESAEKELHTLDEAVLSRTAEGSELYALNTSNGETVECGADDILPALIETALGVENAFSIASASPRVQALFLGAEDLSADLHCKRTKEGAEILYARTRLVMAARAAGIDVYDTPFTDVDDDEGLCADAALAKSLGFTGKAAISPRHLGNINRCFSPTQAEVDHANEVLAALEEGKRQGRGAVALHGKMIDAPIAARAKRTLADAEQILKRGGTLA